MSLLLWIQYPIVCRIVKFSKWSSLINIRLVCNQWNSLSNCEIEKRISFLKKALYKIIEEKYNCWSPNLENESCFACMSTLVGWQYLQVPDFMFCNRCLQDSDKSEFCNASETMIFTIGSAKKDQYSLPLFTHLPESLDVSHIPLSIDPFQVLPLIKRWYKKIANDKISFQSWNGKEVNIVFNDDRPGYDFELGRSDETEAAYEIMLKVIDTIYGWIPILSAFEDDDKEVVTLYCANRDSYLFGQTFLCKGGKDWSNM